MVAVEESDDILLYEVSRAGPSLRARTSSFDQRQERMLRRARSADLDCGSIPTRVISRTLQLPAAGRDYLKPIIEHRLDRLTPWKPEKVLYGFALGYEAAVGDTWRWNSPRRPGHLSRRRSHG
jgi:general secretion pathway protein L